MTRYRTLRLASLGAVALVLELTVLDVYAWKGARPELLLLLACFAALFAREESQALLACWILGLFKDLASVGPPGWHALLFLGLGAVVFRFRQLINLEHLASQIALSAGAAAALATATAALVTVTAGGVPASLWIARLTASVLLTALLGPCLISGLAGLRFLKA